MPRPHVGARAALLDCQVECMQAPTAAATIEQFELLLAGRVSRDAADRWAAQWVASADPPRMDSAIWKALTRLFGCDLKQGPGGLYLHSDDQIRDWMIELKAAVSGNSHSPLER